MAVTPASAGRPLGLVIGLVLGLVLVTLCAGAPAAARAGPTGPAPPDVTAPYGAPPGVVVPGVVVPDVAVPGDAPGGGTAYTWPLRPVPAVEVAFREPTHRFGPGHRGVDLAAEPFSAARSTPR